MSAPLVAGFLLHSLLAAYSSCLPPVAHYLPHKRSTAVLHSIACRCRRRCCSCCSCCWCQSGVLPSVCMPGCRKDPEGRVLVVVSNLRELWEDKDCMEFRWVAWRCQVAG